MISEKYIRLFKAVIKFIRLDSIRSRIIFTSVSFVCLLFVAAYFSNTMVSRTNTTSDANSLQRQQALAHLTEITEIIWDIDTSLEEFLIEQDPLLSERIISRLEELLRKLPELNKLSFYEDTTNNDQITLLLGKYSRNLKKSVDKILKVSGSRNELYPALHILSTKLKPITEEFSNQLDIAINSAKENHYRAKEDEILVLFQDTKSLWQELTGSFSHLAATRFYLDANKLGITSRSHQRYSNKLAGKIQSNIDKLNELHRSDYLTLNQTNSLGKIKNLLPVWLNYQQKVLGIYTSEILRRDKVIMMKEILPTFRKLWITVKLLNDNTAEFTSRDITAMRRTSDKLSDAIWLLAIIGALTTILGFLMYEFAVLRPIRDVSNALNAEAQGVPGPVLKDSTAIEISNLVNAYYTMRSKVNSRQQRLQAIFENAAEGIITADEHGTIESFNAAAESLFLYSSEDVIGKNFNMLLADNQGAWNENIHKFTDNDDGGLVNNEREVLGRRSNNKIFSMSLKISKILLDGDILYSALVSDVSERKAMMEHLKNIAERDALTGLSNRYHFQIELERVVHEVRRDSSRLCALLYIDLDNFKYLNDTLGHAAGDMLLSEVADNLGKRTRRSDLVSRIGGDEFTLLIYDTNYSSVQKVAEDYQKFLSSYTFNYKGNQYDTGCSIGVAIINSNTNNAEEVLSQADFACHLAKSAGKNRIHMFNPESKAEISNLTQDISWSRKIRDAIDNDQFYLVYQPIIKGNAMVPEYFEVLIRLKENDNGVIMPAGFIRTAERFGLAPDIDKWVVKNALKKLAQYHRSNPQLKFTINLSGNSVSDTGVLAVIQQTIELTGINPETIMFEVTETAAIEDLAAARLFLAELRDMGCKTAVDDFGAGMSSFTYLQDLPVDIVKIDGRYVENLDSNPVNLALIHAMNNIAHALGCKTVLECVKDKPTFDLVQNLNIDYFQGYYFQKPALAPLYEVRNNESDDSSEVITS